jgi:hypothetical protein
MTDLLDRPVAAGEPDEPDEPDESGPQPRTDTGPEGPAPPRPDRWFLAALLVGAGAIHVAMAPSHLGESAIEGAGFLAAAWIQVALAVAVLVRPTRRVLAAVIVASLAFIGVWVVSRTAGLPFGDHAGHAESVTLVDGICVALEGVAVVVAVLMRTVVGVALARARGVALAGAVGAVLLATGAIASPAARNHAAHSHGDGAGEAAAGEDGMHGGTHEHGTAGANSEGDDLGFAELSNGHQHEHGSDEALTADERVLLARQLAATADLVERYPTIADAEAAGWTRAGPFSPGLGTHYMAPRDGRRGVPESGAMGRDGTMDPDRMPLPMLVYDGLEPGAPLAGFMYTSYGTDGEPAGFAGPNDHWHYHESVCIVMRDDGSLDTPFGADLEGVTEDMCTDVGGQWITATTYMVHVWNVPGYESPDGMFTELNPKITCRDGTYHRIPIEETGSRDSVCRDA